MPTATDRAAATSVPVLDAIARRWSPRAFDPSFSLAPGALAGPLEALRWAPSAVNSQPWRVVVARRGSALHSVVLSHLAPGNQAWAAQAAALVVAVAQTVDDSGRRVRWAEYDLGQAMAAFAIEASAEGLATHTMGGFDAAGLHDELGLADGMTAVAVVAVGRPGDPAALPEPLRERELAPRARKGLDQIVLASQ